MQVGGASRLKRFVVLLMREGLDRARGILPPEALETHEFDADAVGFAAAFSEEEEFDEIPDSADDGAAQPPGAGPHVLSLAGRRRARGLRAVAHRVAQPRRDAPPVDRTARAARLVVDDVAPLLRVVVAQRRRAPGRRACPGTRCSPSPARSSSDGWASCRASALIFAIPVGAIGISRLLKGRVSNRARVIAAIAYMALPLGLDMISQGRIDVLVVVAVLPFIVRRLFELMDVPGFRTQPYGEPVAFGHRGWRTTWSGQRMVAVMLIALAHGDGAGDDSSSSRSSSSGSSSRGSSRPTKGSTRPDRWRFLGSLWLNVAILLLPLTVDVAIAGRRALGVFGLARGPWSVPSFAELLRATDGGFGLSWAGWLLPGAALIGLLLCRGERRRIATKAASIATLTLLVASLDARHWMGSFAPDLDVLLALYVVMLALLIGLGVSAFENDLRHAGFGWRQVGGRVCRWRRLVVAAVPFAAVFAERPIRPPDDERRRVVEHALAVERPGATASCGSVTRRCCHSPGGRWRRDSPRRRRWTGCPVAPRSSRRPTRARATSSWTPSSRR